MGLVKGIIEDGVLFLEDYEGKVYYIYFVDIEIK